jgi:hypothetical protein
MFRNKVILCFISKITNIKVELLSVRQTVDKGYLLICQQIKNASCQEKSSKQCYCSKCSD